MNDEGGSLMLDVENLTTNYGSIAALRSASLTVGAGEVVGLVGPNGAGKTTLVGTLAGLLSPASGSVRLDGVDVTGATPDALLRRGLALVPEHRRLFADLTVAENLRIGGITVKASERGSLIDEMVELFPVLAAKMSTAACSRVATARPSRCCSPSIRSRDFSWSKSASTSPACSARA